MKKQASPRLIGAFVVLAFLVLAVLVGLVGSFKAFQSRQTFVVYFKGSVNNLNVGAKVKWKGVPVGQVSDIRIRWNQDVLSTDIPVFIQLDLDRLGLRIDETDVMKREVASGLRARTQMESLISGMLYIDLDYIADAAPARFVEKEPLYPEIPAAPSPFDEIGDLAFRIADNIANIDF
ncbi:MAG TPA: MlaD family protein, partial [Opitutales bacterium]|nr:MlaD family protein [Opitutales bacterium]